MLKIHQFSPSLLSLPVNRTHIIHIMINDLLVRHCHGPRSNSSSKTTFNSQCCNYRLVRSYSKLPAIPSFLHRLRFICPSSTIITRICTNLSTTHLPSATRDTRPVNWYQHDRRERFRGDWRGDCRRKDQPSIGTLTNSAGPVCRHRKTL